MVSRGNTAPVYVALDDWHIPMWAFALHSRNFRHYNFMSTMEYLHIPQGMINLDRINFWYVYVYLFVQNIHCQDSVKVLWAISTLLFLIVGNFWNSTFTRNVLGKENVPMFFGTKKSIPGVTELWKFPYCEIGPNSVWIELNFFYKSWKYLLVTVLQTTGLYVYINGLIYFIRNWLIRLFL